MEDGEQGKQWPCTINRVGILDSSFGRESVVTMDDKDINNDVTLRNAMNLLEVDMVSNTDSAFSEDKYVFRENVFRCNKGDSHT